MQDAIILYKGADWVAKSIYSMPQRKQNQIIISYEQILLISFWTKTKIVC